MKKVIIGTLKSVKNDKNLIRFRGYVGKGTILSFAIRTYVTVYCITETIKMLEFKKAEKKKNAKVIDIVAKEVVKDAIKEEIKDN